MNVKLFFFCSRLSDCSITEEGYKALASALRSNPSHLIELDLSGNDPGQSGVKELSDLLQDPNCQLKTLRFLGPAADEGCQYVTGIMGKNPLLQGDLDLSGHKLGDTRVNQIAALLQDKHCTLNTLILCRCSITEKQCLILTSALKSNPSHLRELSLSGNKLGDSGVKNLRDLLMNPQFKLEKLKLSDCSITEEGYRALASALRSNPSHLIELDLTGNDPGQSGVEELNDLLQDPNCQLKTLRFLGPAADEGCKYVTGIVGKNPLLLRELNLSGHKLEDTRVNQIAALLQDKHCQLNRLFLCRCSITEKQWLILTSALKSNPLHLRELNLSGNKLGDSGVKNLSDLLMNPQFKLEKLQLSDCSITEEGYKALALALRSNPSHLIELDLTGNDPGQSGVKELNDLLQDPNCQLKTLRFLHPAADEGSQYVTGIMGKNPLLLRELNLSEHKLGDTRVKQIAALLQDKHCQLNRLILSDCSITEEGYKALASALRSNPSHLIELNLSGNDPGQSGMKELNDLLQDPNCQLKTLRFLGPAADEGCKYVTGIVGKNPLLQGDLDLSEHKLGDTEVNQIAALLQDKHCQLNRLFLLNCSITEKHCHILTSALKSNPSHLRQLSLSWNTVGDSGVKNLSDLLMNPQCKLELLHLWRCSITEKQCRIVTSALKSNPSHLRQLSLSWNELGDSGVKNVSDLLMNPQLQLELLHLGRCSITEEQCRIVTSALKSNLSHLRELELSWNPIKNAGVNHVCDVLKDSRCKLERL
ncbi:hypothetical protein QQF64_019726, partial [Cirrhinus molitorella]